MEKTDSQTELDLIDLIKICWRWFVSYVWYPILFLLRFAIVKWWVLILGIVLGALVSVTLWLEFPVYQGSLILVNNVSDSSDFINNLKIFNLTSHQNKADATGIPLEVVDKIMSIKPHFICYSDSLRTNYYIDYGDSVTIKERVPLSNKFCIEIKARDSSVFQYVDSGFVNYFNNSQYYKKLNDQRIAELNAQIEMAQTESHRLDSIMNKRGDEVLFGLSGSGNMMSSMVKPAEIVNEKLHLGNIILSSRQTLNHFSDIVTISSGTQTEPIPKNFFLFTIKKYVVLSVILCYVVALLIVYRAEIKNFICKKR